MAPPKGNLNFKRVEMKPFPIIKNETINVGKFKNAYISSQQAAGIQPTKNDVRRNPVFAINAGPKPIPAVSPMQHAPIFVL